MVPTHPDCVLTLNELPPSDNCYWDSASGAWAVMPPGEKGWTFNWATKEWEDPRTLDDLKRQALAAIEKEKVTRKSAPVEYQGRRVDAHATAMGDITSKLAELSALAELGLEVDPESLSWRDAENRTVAFTTAAEMKAWLMGLVVAVSQRNSAVYSWSWAEKELVRAAQTAAEVDATGWRTE